MVDIPHIFVYELFQDRPAQKVETLMAPDELYALATAMSYVEIDFKTYMRFNDEKFAQAARVYQKICKSLPPKADEDFDQYCKCCAEVGALADKPGWTIDPGDISKGVRAFLWFVFLVNRVIKNDDAKGLSAIFQHFHQHIKRVVERWDDPTPAYVRILRILLFPLYLLSSRRRPAYENNFNREIGIKALAILERLIRIFDLAHNAGRSFSFDLPADQAEGNPVLGDARMSLQKDGHVASDQESL